MRREAVVNYTPRQQIARNQSIKQLSYSHRRRYLHNRSEAKGKNNSLFRFVRLMLAAIDEIFFPLAPYASLDSSL